MGPAAVSDERLRVGGTVNRRRLLARTHTWSGVDLGAPTRHVFVSTHQRQADGRLKLVRVEELMADGSSKLAYSDVVEREDAQ